jgi:predicted molibdopterin-dependent oxidoreductase YjgC
MTRTGKSATLADHIAESFVDMHPQDALLSGVREGELARITSEWGAMVARVQHGGGIPRGSVFIPIHWNGQTASDARVARWSIRWWTRCRASRNSSTRRCAWSSSASTGMASS